MALYSQPQTDDLELVLGIARRESEAFAAFYDRHASRIFALLYRLLGERAEAEDALQDTFWQVWRQAGTHDSSRGTPMAWLVQIARSRGLDRLRQARTRAQRDGGSVDDMQERLPADQTTENDVIARESQQTIRRRLAALPADQQEVITLAYFDGLTHQEIAERLKIPLGTIKTRIRLGMRKLQEAFQGTK
jgi:RNA polymerase sigma-70 factor (ECF subfamily)